MSSSFGIEFAFSSGVMYGTLMVYLVAKLRTHSEGDKESWFKKRRNVESGQFDVEYLRKQYFDSLVI